jgi:putative cell wall-binding protein
MLKSGARVLFATLTALALVGMSATAASAAPGTSQICGTMMDDDWSGVDAHGTVEAWLVDISGTSTVVGETNAGYNYCVTGLAAGEYRLRFVPDVDAGSPFVREWWQDTYSEDYASEVTLGSNQTVTVNFNLTELSPDRLGGVDRYAANVAMSQEIRTPGESYSLPVLYIASGEKYPDALSAGPLAIANNGGLLLVRYGDIPAVTLAEIQRLNPQRIVVVGGPASVSPAVYSQLAGLTGAITRITGADRYEVSRNLLSQELACDTAPCLATVFVVTGRNFPDALSAGPAAAHVGGAVLLVDGAQGSLVAPSLALLDDLGVDEAYIAGGPASVSPAIKSHLESVLSGPVTRFTGSDRYEAAAAMNSAIFGESPTVFLSTGLKFADALAGGPIAGVYDAPLYLAPAVCLPESVQFSIRKRFANRVVFLGGPASLADDAISRLC